MLDRLRSLTETLKVQPYPAGDWTPWIPERSMRDMTRSEPEFRVEVLKSRSALKVLAWWEEDSEHLHVEAVFSGGVEGMNLRISDASETRVLSRDALTRHPALTGVLRLIADEVEMKKGPGTPALLSLLFKSLMIYASRMSGPVALCKNGPIVRDRRIERALQLLNEDISKRWSVALLARKVGLSRAAFARQFSRVMGRSPMRHLTDKRMQLAATLLFGSDAALAHIAASVGYGSEFAFSRAFKRHFQMSPSEYRRPEEKPQILMCQLAA